MGSRTGDVGTLTVPTLAQDLPKGATMTRRLPMLTTFEVRCEVCGLLKWPRLAERPDRYVCALCLSVPPEKRLQRRAAAAQGQKTKRGRV